MIPDELKPKLQVDSPLHKKLVTELRDQIQWSLNESRVRHDSWNEVEENERLFVSTNRNDKKGNPKNPYESGIVVPHTLAVRETILTYLWMQWAARNPINPVVGQGPEDVDAAKLIALVDDSMMHRTRGLLTLYCWMQCAVSYGLGIVKNRWTTKTSVRRRNGVRRLGLDFEGVESSLIDPYAWINDPNYSQAEFQRGDFAGWSYKMTRMEIKRRAKDEGWINVEHLKEQRYGDSAYPGAHENLSVRNTVMDVPDYSTSTGYGQKAESAYIMYEIWKWIIPNEWEGLGTSKDPELWMFTIADAEIILDATPSDFSEFPFFVLEPMPDLLGRFTPGLMELLRDLQRVLNWIFNTRLKYVEASLEGTIFIDPFRYDMDDFLDKGPGKRVRQTGEFKGQDPRAGVHYMAMADPTGGHGDLLSTVVDLMQRVTSATDSIQGIVETGRRSASEITGAARQAGSRLQKLAEIMAVQGIHPWFANRIELIQTFMSEAQWVRLVGDSELAVKGMRSPPPLQSAGGQNFLQVKPIAIEGHYDFPVMTGAPADGPALAQNYLQMLQLVSGNQVLTQRFDLLWIFRRWALAMGIRNLNEAEIKAPEEQQEQLSRAVQAGNVAPVPETPIPPGILAGAAQGGV